MTDITENVKKAEEFAKIGDEYMLDATKDKWIEVKSFYSNCASAYYLQAIYEQNKAIIKLLQEKKE